MFFYSDTEKSTFDPRTAVPYHRQNANKNYLKHYDNYLYLNFILERSEDRIERYQAGKELTICERKLRHWYRHANFDIDSALPEISKRKKEWDLRNIKIIS